MKCAVGITIVLASGCSASVMLRQDMWRMRNQFHQSLSAVSAEDDQYPELWYDQQLVDHFNQDDKRTFKQRYFANFDHYKPGGPILINIGGEGPLDPKDVSGYLSNALFAKELGGATIAVEHRFYGKSQPFDSLNTEHLSYLTSRQALHDLAKFQQWFIASNTSFAKSNFFCMGGSYPGNLAAWYRLEFPNMTMGCWSASGPVHAQQDWPGFGEKVWKAVSTDINGQRDDTVAMKLYAGYEQLAGLIQDPTPEAAERLKDVFNVCPGTLVSQGDRDNFEMTVTTAPGSVMQYNNTRSPKLAAIRKLVINASTAFDAALAVSKFLNLTVGSGDNDCVDNGIGSFYALLSDASLPKSGEGNAARTWTWQTCNEFGYFQTATRKFGVPSLYTRGASARSLWQQVCGDVFGIAEGDIGARIAKTNAYYGGKDPRDISRVFFSNGDLDAWSLLSVVEYPSNDRDVSAMVAPLGSHCVGLYAPMDGEVPGATAIRDHAFQLFKKWDAQARSATVYV